jgi:hypothetical protein
MITPGKSSPLTNGPWLHDSRVGNPYRLAFDPIHSCQVWDGKN